MGQYFTYASLDVNGNYGDKKKLLDLLMYMNFDKTAKISLPLHLEDAVENAIFGTIDYEKTRNTKCMPDFQLTKAPLLIAALFPDLSFHLEAEYEYSAGGGKTGIVADYNNDVSQSKEFVTIASYQTEDDFEKLTEEVQQDYEDDLLDEDQLIAEIMHNNGEIKYAPVVDTAYLDSFLVVYLKKMREAGLI